MLSRARVCKPSKTGGTKPDVLVCQCHTILAGKALLAWSHQSLRQGTRLGGASQATCDKADDQADERIRGHKVELRLGRGARGRQACGRGALAVEAVGDGQLRQVAEEALRQIVSLSTCRQCHNLTASPRQPIIVFHSKVICKLRYPPYHAVSALKN